MTLREMREVDIRAVNVNDLVELSTVHTDPEQAKSVRMKDYINQVKNPYCFRKGKTVIKTSYAKTGPTIEELLANVIMRLLEHE